ncbi:MBL fold metallo-hydrolase [Salinibacter sp. 10B]|uniref:MBL fold metallo-hydrolase n=1 Tax=Salinibacter sp. 10B TaxID=1923971 RepID=UPI000CF40EB0|nr:MBL fold metallo-hydrolase [Salinibacter sp. 10B]PQJ35834.1 MBL fold metallo-hydrolase [Salinibacter sp. 10B]
MPDIGPYSLYSIETGRFGLDGGAMFGIVPKPLWSKRIAPDESNRIPLHMRCLLLEGPNRLILVDTGIGDVFAGTKYEDIYAVDHEYATLEGSLSEHGVSAGEVTDVILTHLHFDHCGGATRATEDGRKVRFPNATYHVQKEHWQWAQDPNPKEQGSFLRRALAPINDAGRLHLLEGGQTLFPGITVECVHGHTQAQQIVRVSDPDTTLVFVADLLPTTHHLAPTWTMAYDVRPLQTMEEKGAFLRRAVNEEWNLFFEHDPDVAVGCPRETDRGMQIEDPRPLPDL